MQNKNRRMAVSVRWVGVEPTRLAAHGPQPCLSANSSTSASGGIITASQSVSRKAIKNQEE